jgi:predicted DNA-binding protein (MmcQ/YjbR family)
LAIGQDLPPTATPTSQRSGDECRRASRSVSLVHGSRGDVSVRPRDIGVQGRREDLALSQLGADSLRVSLKCEPQLAEALRGAHAAVIPGYHLNKRHWNTVIIDGSIPDGAIRDMIEDSYDLVVSKLPQARRRALGWDGDAG